MSQSDEPQYPEHEKLDSDKAEVLISFLEHLQERDMFVAHSDGQWLTLCDATVPSRLIAEYLGIDPVKLEAERRDMLARLAELN